MVNLLTKDPWERIEVNINLMVKIAKETIADICDDYRNLRGFYPNKQHWDKFRDPDTGSFFYEHKGFRILTGGRNETK